MLYPIIDYKIGDYRLCRGNIYKLRKWLPFYKLYERGPAGGFRGLDGIRKVNKLAGIYEP